MTTNRGLQALQREAWAFGRSLRDSLLADFEGEYGEPAPPPALIGGELLTDFLGARLSYDALPLNVFAETTWHDGQPLVTVNSRTREIEGVKDPEGVSNVGIWHEVVHVQRDISTVRLGPQTALEGMRPNLTIACHRDRQRSARRGEEFPARVFRGGVRTRCRRLLSTPHPHWGIPAFHLPRLNSVSRPARAAGVPSTPRQKRLA